MNYNQFRKKINEWKLTNGKIIRQTYNYSDFYNWFLVNLWKDVSKDDIIKAGRRD